MSEAKKRAVQYASADGRSTVAGYFYTDAQAEPFCIVQLSHGMCEYIGRYDDFALWLAERGVVVYGNDHLGHGDTAEEADRGYLSGKGGHMYALEDLKTMNEMARQAHPGLPLILLGHSMGSLFARKYAATWPETIDGLIISGTLGPNPVADVGIALASLIGAVKGERYRSAFIQNMAFGSYTKRIPDAKTPHDWITRDEEIITLYANDPLCTFRFTVSGFREILYALRDVSGAAWAERIRKTMPVLMISGDQDPAGGYGAGVTTVHGWLREAGLEDLEFKLYEGARHEVLNETNRAEVYEDVLQFLRKHWSGKQA